jgi:hypothetical protein
MRWSEHEIVEPPRRVPIVGESDVLVVGGGPAGVAAALAAARNGAHVTLVERYGFLGGLWTAGLVNPILDYQHKGGLVAEIIQRLDQRGETTPQLRFHPEGLKRLTDEMCLEAGVELRLHRWVNDVLLDGKQVRGVITESKSGREALLAKVVIDCTGDGDVCARAGVPYTLGRESDGLMQALTTFFMLANVQFQQAETYELYDLLDQARQKHGIDYHIPYRQPTAFELPAQGVTIVQLTHMHGYDGTNADDLTQAEIEGRRQTHEALGVLRQIPGFEEAELIATAPNVGVRETRHIHGRYRLQETDLLAGRHFKDGICTVRFGIDIHGPLPSGQEQTIRIEGQPVPPYQIPYRCLLPQDRSYLLMAGQCVSATSRAHSSLRVTGDCVAMGQAAGTAAALAIQQELAPDVLDPQALLEQLKADGAHI